jgi:hypothetical protein
LISYEKLTPHNSSSKNFKWNWIAHNIKGFYLIMPKYPSLSILLQTLTTHRIFHKETSQGTYSAGSYKSSSHGTALKLPSISSEITGCCASIV